MGQSAELDQVVITLVVPSQKQEMIILFILRGGFFMPGVGSNIGLKSYNGLNTLFLTFFIKINDSIHNSVVSYGHGRRTLFLGGLYQLIYLS